MTKNARTLATNNRAHLSRLTLVIRHVKWLTLGYYVHVSNDKPCLRSGLNMFPCST